MSTEAPAVAAGLWRNRNWRLLFAGGAISVLGDQIFDVTIVLWIATVIAKGQTWAPMAVGGALIAVAAPVFLIGPFAGVFVDRWDRPRTMLVTDLVRAVLVAALLVLPALGNRVPALGRLVVVYGILALASASAQFFNGARFGILAMALAPSDQPRAAASTEATMAIAAIAGPPLAAPLLFTVGVQWALIANAASFLISYVFTQRMRVDARPSAGHAAEAPNFRREFVEGARFFLRNRILRGLMICIIVAQLGIGAINALDVFFVTENLHASATSLGVLGGAFGIGTVLGALLAVTIGSRIRPGQQFWVGLLLTGVAVIAYSRAGSLVAGLVVLLVAGIPLAVVNSVGGPIMMSTTPQHLLGRVMSVFNPIQQLVSIIGMALVSYLASTVLRGLDTRILGVHFGRIDIVFFVSGLLIAVAGAWVALPLRAGTPTPAPPAVPEAALPVPDEQAA
jgi:MFS family permease